MRRHIETNMGRPRICRSGKVEQLSIWAEGRRAGIGHTIGQKRAFTAFEIEEVQVAIEVFFQARVGKPLTIWRGADFRRAETKLATQIDRDILARAGFCINREELHVIVAQNHSSPFAAPIQDRVEVRSDIVLGFLTEPIMRLDDEILTTIPFHDVGEFLTVR